MIYTRKEWDSILETCSDHDDVYGGNLVREIASFLNSSNPDDIESFNKKLGIVFDSDTATAPEVELSYVEDEAFGAFMNYFDSVRMSRKLPIPLSWHFTSAAKRNYGMAPEEIASFKVKLGVE